MPIVYVDADACPVKAEVCRVAARYRLAVYFAANAPFRLPAGPSITLTIVPGFGEVDNHIAERAGLNDIVITADIPLAARCVAAGAMVIDPKGRLLTDVSVAGALATRDLMEELRQSGVVTGGPAPMLPKDRSRFLSKLDETINAVLRGKPR
jgi:uncharacterized protein YaiI (UPF0178 family)